MIQVLQYRLRRLWYTFLCFILKKAITVAEALVPSRNTEATSCRSSLEELKIPKASYGCPIPLLYGEFPRMSCDGWRNILGDDYSVQVYNYATGEYETVYTIAEYDRVMNSYPARRKLDDIYHVDNRGNVYCNGHPIIKHSNPSNLGN